MNEEEDLSLNKKIDALYHAVTKSGNKEIRKKLGIPRRAKTSRSRKKKSWVGVLFLSENKTITGQKVKLEGGTFRTKKDDFIHVTDGSEQMSWNGKYPVIFQRYDKLNPTNLFAKPGDKNEMYGQDLVKLRYKRDLIKEKKKGGMSIIIIIAILVGAYFILKQFLPGILGG